MSDQPTPEEIRKVREHECRTQGHDFEILTVSQSLDPNKILCSNCGESWPVGESERGKAKRLKETMASFREQMLEKGQPEECPVCREAWTVVERIPGMWRVECPNGHEHHWDDDGKSVEPDRFAAEKG